MSEAKEGCVRLEDVEESTFIRFSQFAYTGDYIAADPEILLDSSTIALTPSKVTPGFDIDGPVAVASKKFPLPDLEPLEPVDIPSAPEPLPETEHDLDQFDDQEKKRAMDGLWGEAWTKPKMEAKDKMGKLAKKKRISKYFETKSRNAPRPSFHPRSNCESCEDYTEVFLCHARLYVFAEKYDIAPLKKLSVNRLHQTLSVFTLYKERVGDIVALMEYSYANTVHRSSFDDPLRSLVIHYAACVVENLVPSSKFKALLEEPGELASDLVVKMINRLNWIVWLKGKVSHHKDLEKAGGGGGGVLGKEGIS